MADDEASEPSLSLSSEDRPEMLQHEHWRSVDKDGMSPHKYGKP